MVRNYPTIVIKITKDHKEYRITECNCCYYSAYIPDFNIYIKGVSKEDVIQTAEEAVLFNISLKKKRNKDIPVASSFEQAKKITEERVRDLAYLSGMILTVSVNIIDTAA